MMNFDNFKPMSDEELDAQNPQFTEGLIDFRVEGSENKTASTGNPMKELSLLVKDVNGVTKEIKEKLVLTPKAMWRVKKFCQSIGKLELYENGSIPDRDINGATGKADAKYESYVDKDGKDKKALKIVMWHEKKKKASSAPFHDDEIPF